MLKDILWLVFCAIFMGCTGAVFATVTLDLPTIARWAVYSAWIPFCFAVGVALVALSPGFRQSNRERKARAAAIDRLLRRIRDNYTGSSMASLSSRDLGRALFAAMRTGSGELNIVIPNTEVRTLDITDPIMLSQRRYRANARRQLAQHNRGRPIVTPKLLLWDD